MTDEPEDLRARVQRLEALEEIRGLVARYAQAVDARDLASRVGGVIRNRLERLNLAVGSLKITVQRTRIRGRVRRSRVQGEMADFATAPSPREEAA